MDKQELALVVIDRLKKEYPDADCTLAVSYTHLTLPTKLEV
mgnify:CR=1 FL=1